jgi:hypothetical protein
MKAHQELSSALVTAVEIPATMTTSQAAAAMNRKTQTLYKWHFTKQGPVQPVTINGRLAWPANQIAALLNGEALQ